MLPFLTVLVVIIGAACLFDLLLTIGVIRRLREHSELLSQRVSDEAAQGRELILPAGAEVGPFEAASIDGILISRQTLPARTLVGVFSPDCPACAERLPAFVARASHVDGGRDQVLAVVVGAGDNTDEQIASLTPVARVVTEARGGAVSSALRVRGFPAFAIVDGSGQVLASGLDLDQLDLPVGV
jgi:hypothetical protein